ncbi:putative membrane protein YedE/YeeE [Oxalobacteraceae bacterium GrIS 2.11]
MITIDSMHFTPVASLIGGGLIGLAAAVLLLWNGRIAGISGIIGGILSDLSRRATADIWWRLLFLSGLLAAPWVYTWFAVMPETVIDAKPAVLIAAGLLVGFGTRLGSGCTSGHGICGLSRLSLRSMIATLSFMLSGFLTVFVVRHLMA